jgi:hypothetical protein
MKVTCAHGLMLDFTSKCMTMLQMQITKEVESFKTTMACLFHPYYSSYHVVHMMELGKWYYILVFTQCSQVINLL